MKEDVSAGQAESINNTATAAGGACKQYTVQIFTVYTENIDPYVHIQVPQM